MADDSVHGVAESGHRGSGAPNGGGLIDPSAPSAGGSTAETGAGNDPASVDTFEEADFSRPTGAHEGRHPDFSFTKGSTAEQSVGNYDNFRENDFSFQHDRVAARDANGAIGAYVAAVVAGNNRSEPPGAPMMHSEKFTAEDLDRLESQKDRDSQAALQDSGFNFVSNQEPPGAPLMHSLEATAKDLSRQQAQRRNDVARSIYANAAVSRTDSPPEQVLYVDDDAPVMQDQLTPEVKAKAAENEARDAHPWAKAIARDAHPWAKDITDAANQEAKAQLAAANKAYTDSVRAAENAAKLARSRNDVARSIYRNVSRPDWSFEEARLARQADKTASAIHDPRATDQAKDAQTERAFNNLEKSLDNYTTGTTVFGLKYDKQDNATKREAQELINNYKSTYGAHLSEMGKRNSKEVNEKGFQFKGGLLYSNPVGIAAQFVQGLANKLGIAYHPTEIEQRLDALEVRWGLKEPERGDESPQSIEEQKASCNARSGYQWDEASNSCVPI
jgi:hypothetical protein